MAKIVVADDDADIRDLVAFKLAQSGHEVIAVADGRAALDACRDHAPALALLDQMMPGMGGLEAVRALRADPGTAGLRIVMLTARAQESDIEQGFAAGVDDYITKPFSPRELAARVGALLGSGRMTPTVRRRVAPVLTLLTVLLVLTGTLGMVSAFLSYRAVDGLTGVVQPAASANAAILQDLTDAETGVRAWGLSGEATALEPYKAAMTRLPRDQATLRRHLPDVDRLAGLVRQQDALAARWLEEYARVRVGRPGGPGTFDRALFFHGKELFDQIRVLHARIATILDKQVDDARSMAVKRVRRTAVALLLFTVLGATLAARSGRRLLQDIRDPLEHLEDVVNRLAQGDLTARAREDGPREVRLVARALNDLAEETERSRAAEAAFAADLRALDTARGDFVSNVSHELRTPLTVLSGYLELVEDEFSGQADEHHQRMIDASRRNVDRLSALIDDLLTLSRAENRSTDLERCDLRSLVREVVDDVRMAAARRDVTMEKQVPEGVVPVLADRGQMVRALVNVVGNAVKFSHPGGRVTVSLDTVDDEAVLTVRDRGIGIPAADLGAIGTRFFRASNAMSAEVPGTGLGLRIVQSIVDNHAGTVALDSVEGEGTVVTVRLPLTVADGLR